MGPSEFPDVNPVPTKVILGRLKLLYLTDFSDSDSY